MATIRTSDGVDLNRTDDGPPVALPGAPPPFAGPGSTPRRALLSDHTRRDRREFPG